MTFEEIEKNETIRAYISKADESLVALGCTEHSFAHVTHVAAMAGYLLETLGYDAHTVELAKIAGYLHDIGNLVNRIEHSQSGAVMAFQILTSLGFGAEDSRRSSRPSATTTRAPACRVNAVAAAPHPRGQGRCAPQPRSQSGHDDIRHPRPRELLREKSPR